MVSKLTNNVKPLDEVDKINEIIDELDNIDPLPSQTGQSGKYLTTNGTVPSWADVQSLPSQTGKAGLYLQTDGTDASWEGVPGRNIGEIVASTIPLTDAGLHLLDGALIQGSGIYSAFVDYIASIYDATANYFCTEQEWQASVTQYGVCGKFVYDSVNNTVRLPKVTGIIEGTTDVSAVGDLVEAGLPNITGWLNAYNPTYTGGAFYIGSTGNNVASGSTGSTGANFDASRSSSIYGNSSTVQPQTIKAFYYIVIATSTKTDIQVDIDEITTDLNGKADIDLSNASPSTSFISNFVSSCMPDYENEITGSSKNWVQCAKDSFVFTCGGDPYTEDYYCYVSPDNGTTKYMVGRRYDDQNGYTQITGFTFLCPKNWYFRCTSESTPSYFIYPLKGAN